MSDRNRVEEFSNGIRLNTRNGFAQRWISRRMSRLFNIPSWSEHVGMKRAEGSYGNCWADLLDFTVYDQPEPIDAASTGVRRLAYAMLVRALEDLCMWVEVQTNGGVEDNLSPSVYDEVDAARFDEVLGWFLPDNDYNQPYPFSECPDITSYAGVCDIVGVNPNKLLEAVFARIREQGAFSVES